MRMAPDRGRALCAASTRSQAASRCRGRPRWHSTRADGASHSTGSWLARSHSRHHTDRTARSTAWNCRRRAAAGNRPCMRRRRRRCRSRRRHSASCRRPWVTAPLVICRSRSRVDAARRGSTGDDPLGVAAGPEAQPVVVVRRGHHAHAALIGGAGRRRRVFHHSGLRLVVLLGVGDLCDSGLVHVLGRSGVRRRLRPDRTAVRRSARASSSCSMGTQSRSAT